MKKSTVFIITFVFLAVFIAFSVFYAKIYKPAHTPEKTSSIYIADNMNREKTGNRILLAELAEEDIQLYQDGGYTILVHSGHEAEFNNWSRVIADEPPMLYYTDFNGDDQKEIIVRALEGVDKNTKEKYYCVYIVFINETETGDYKYDVAYCSRSTWTSIFDETLTRQTSQPIYNPKRIQFVMAMASKTIPYDSATGITRNPRAWYIKALSDGKNNYYTLKDWYIGTPILSVDTEQKCIRIQANYYITYHETDEVQLGGTLNCGLSYVNNKFGVANRSVTFSTAPEYRVTSLLKLSEGDWNYTFNNSASYSSNDRVIDNTSFKCTMQSDISRENSIFSGTTDDTKAIERITLNQNTLKLYARPGYRFSADIVNNFKYSVTVPVGSVPADITLSASIGEENGISVLTFVLDKDYPQNELDKFTVNLGQ